MRKLPPLNAIKAFEAAGRHQSFTLAANELHVTHGAVSRQVKTLESFYNVPLFRRRPRKIILTDIGEQLLAVASDVLDQLANAGDLMAGERLVLTLKVGTTFAVRWLLPRLPDFERRYPNFHVRLTTAAENVDFSTEVYDAGISYGEFDDSRLYSVQVAAEMVAPVCAPALLPDGVRLPAAELGRMPLVLTTPNGWDWNRWSEVLGLGKLDLGNALRFDIYDPGIQASVAGHGVMLADLSFIDDELRSGSLVFATDAVPMDLGAYYLVCPRHLSEAPRMIAFRQWLLEQASPPYLSATETTTAGQIAVDSSARSL